METTSRLEVVVGEGRGENRMTADWCRVSVWAEENVLEPESGNDCTTS